MACPWGNTVISQTSRTTINEFGFKFGTAFFVIELFICVLGLLAHLPWLISTNPIGPATRIHLDNAYFATLMSSSSQCQDIVEMCNSESFEIWQALDRVVRVGESLNSYEDDLGTFGIVWPVFLNFSQTLTYHLHLSVFRSNRFGKAKGCSQF